MMRWIALPGGGFLPTYLTMLTVGFCLATFVVRREARREGLPVRAIFDVALLVVPVSLFFGRLAVIVQDPAFWLTHLTSLFWHGGFVFYGSFLGVAAGLWFGARWRGLDPWRVLDIFSVAMPFGVIFGRLGCLGAGCCHGRPADWPLGLEVPWGITYLNHASPVPDAMLAVSLHPTPIYDSLSGLVLFVALSHLRTLKPPPGVVFASLLIGYAGLRAFTELFRGDLMRGLWWGGLLSTSQLTGLVVAAFGLALLRQRRRACIPG